jgi:hypothetical protein
MGMVVTKRNQLTIGNLTGICIGVRIVFATLCGRGLSYPVFHSGAGQKPAVFRPWTPGFVAALDLFRGSPVKLL